MQYITPAIIALVIIIALSRKKPLYTDFISGAEDGIDILKSIFPPLVAMLTAAAMVRASGALELALVLIRPVSGSGSIGVLSGILNDCGADSLPGRLASVICGSTETTFYCLAVYFSKTRVKHIKRAVPCAVIGDLTGIAAAVFALRLLGM